MPDGLQQYTELEHRLVLLAWLNSLLGYRSNRELLEDCKRVGEGFGADGISFLCHHLIARGSQVSISLDKLAEYDENVRQHLEKINRGRTEKITLRYFQHLAALYTEIVLDRLFNAKAQLLAESKLRPEYQPVPHSVKYDACPAQPGYLRKDQPVALATEWDQR